MSFSSFRFVAGKPALDLFARSLKAERCPFCERSKFLNLHSFLYGNDPGAAASACARSLRGQRVYCSNRGLRDGCGRTFPVFFAGVLPRHSVTASFLWILLCLLLAGGSLKAAAESLRLPFCLETLYRLRSRLRLRADIIRSLLFGLAPSLARARSPQTCPLLATVEALAAAFAGSGSSGSSGSSGGPAPEPPESPLHAFQRIFQAALFG